MGVTSDGRRRRARATQLVLACAMALLVAGCSGSDADDSAATTIVDEETTAPETSSTTTSSSTTEAPTTETTADQPSDDELVEQMMETVTAFGRAYGACLADPAACEVEADLGSYLGQPLRGQVDSAMARWAADGVELRGFADEEYQYSEHEQALSEPPTYGLAVCVTTGPQAIYEVSGDGTESLVEDLGGPSVQLRQMLLEQRPSGEFVINVSQTGDETAEGNTCDGDSGE